MKIYTYNPLCLGSSLFLSLNSLLPPPSASSSSTIPLRSLFSLYFLSYPFRLLVLITQGAFFPLRPSPTLVSDPLSSFCSSYSLLFFLYLLSSLPLPLRLNSCPSTYSFLLFFFPSSCSLFISLTSSLFVSCFPANDSSYPFSFSSSSFFSR